MRKIFFRYFLSILALAILVMLIQMGILYVRYYVSQNRWKSQVYEDFVESVEDSISLGGFSDFGLNTIYKLASAIDDDRISGFLLRDASSSNMVSFGKTPNGRTLTSLFTSNAKLTDTVQKSVKNHVYISIVTNGFGRVVSASATNKTGSYNVNLPSSMKDEEIIGSISIALDGKVAFVIDLLTYSPMTYEYSKDIIVSCYRGFLISIPICLIFALLFAWIISSTNAKYINDVRKALKDLSNGKPNVKLPFRSYSELDEITNAIEDLDRNLQANAKSRKAWLRSISHDLNTPVASLKIMIEGLSDGVFDCDKQTLASLQTEIDTLSERIERVTDFSSLQADATVTITFCTSESLVENVLCNFDKEYNIKTNLMCQNLKCDISLMSRASFELLNNALEAGNGIATWTIEEDEKSYHMIFENKGTLEEDMDAPYFEPWTRGSWSRTKGGSGLGLPIAVTILYLHKGTISLKQNQDNVLCEVSWPKD